ncbi:MAG: hypothetical protein ACK5QH_18155, partial [Rubrivivax sp.]
MPTVVMELRLMNLAMSAVMVPAGPKMFSGTQPLEPSVQVTPSSERKAYCTLEFEPQFTSSW